MSQSELYVLTGSQKAACVMAGASSLVIHQSCRPTSTLQRIRGAQSRYPELTHSKPAAAILCCFFSWLQESCAACQTVVQDQGFEAAKVSDEGRIRGADTFVLAIFCKTGKSNLFPIAERRMDLPLGLIEPLPLPPVSAVHTVGLTASYPESDHLTDFLALCTAQRHVKLPCV